MPDDIFDVADEMTIERMAEVEDSMRVMEYDLAWLTIKRVLAAERVNHTQSLRHAEDMNTVCRMQSALQMIDWMEALPGIIRTRMQEAQEEYRNATGRPADTGRGYPDL